MYTNKILIRKEVSAGKYKCMHYDLCAVPCYKFITLKIFCYTIKHKNVK